METREPVLVVMAAGIGSRYGAGVKQLAQVGPSGELIIDYSVYDAIAAGFKKVIFIIRKEIEADFRECIGEHMSDKIEVMYAFQDGDDLPAGFTKPEERTKPWGTGHAVLACRELIHEPFAVINADDYYGREAFEKMYKYLKEGVQPGTASMVAFIIKNTLSDNGTVTRGICQVNDEGELTGVQETKGIVKGTDGVIRGTYNDADVEVASEAMASMNFWGFAPEFMTELKEGFIDFLSEVPEGNISAEYLLPDLVDRLLKLGKLKVDVMTSSDKWFGLTYIADFDSVAADLKSYVAEGKYPTPLF